MDCPFNVDPRLPALPLVFDLDAVRRLFQEHWPASGGSARLPRSVSFCRRLDTKYQPSKRCVASYELLVEQTAGLYRSTIGVVDVTPRGVAHRLFVDDSELPGLRSATDPDSIAERFVALLEQMNCRAAVESCVVVPVRYKPESRCVLRYDLRAATGCLSLYGKLVAHYGEGLTAAINTLHQVSQRIPAMPRVVRLLAYWPDLGMLVQPSVDGDELNQCAFDDAESITRRTRWMYRAGECLAALHGSGVVSEVSRSLEDDLEELQQYHAPVAMISPALGTRYAEAVRAVASVAQGQIEPAPVPSHGAFRTDQLLVEQDQLTVIDLDSFCHANPARDVGNFLAYLHWKAIRKPQHAPFIERSKRAFVEGYLEAGSTLEPFWLALYQAVSLLKIAGRRYRGLSVAEWPLVPHLLDRALAVVSSAAPATSIMLLGFDTED